MVRSGARVAGIWLPAWLAYRLVRLRHRGSWPRWTTATTHTTIRERRGNTISQLLRSVGRVVIFVMARLLTLNV